ncbi:MAG: putative molybdenum cofactor guanylyltransferase [Nitrospirales bacterium]|nr:MAG: putative molybdenum cofactor guanylyltransferase [Nitrospirales bacterium]
MIGFSGVVLAGGLSRRMGQDKRGVTVGGQTLFNRVLSVYESVFTEIIIVVAEHSPMTEGLSHKVVTDIIPQKGPLGGLYTGLSYSGEPCVFMVACDMPFLSIPLVRRLCDMSLNSDVLMVQLQTGVQPMQGVYSKKCLPVLKSMIEANHLEMRDIVSRAELVHRIIDQKEVKDLDPSFISFMNVNTPADLEMANKFSGS